MENTKDTFYITMRNRLATINPQRIMMLKGIQKPGILVEEAEAVTPQLRADAFVLRWTALQADAQLPSTLTQMTCEFHYTTSGTQTNSGLDRGRALAEMDAEVLAMLSPHSAQKMNYSQSTASEMNTLIFWADAEFSPIASLRDRLTRVVKVTVFGFQEQGEL